MTHLDPDVPAHERLRPLDRTLLGLEPHPDHPDSLSLVVVPRLCRTDGRFYGGAAVAAAIAAGEAATGRGALWSSTQLVSVADLEERIRVDVEVVASGRTVDQVQVRGTVGDRLVFNAVGATATPRDDGMHASGQTMPRVPAPEDCDPWMGPSRRAAGEAPTAAYAEPPTIGHHVVCQHLDAPLLDAAADRPGHMALWTRLSGDMASWVPTMTPATLAFLADLVPIAICLAAGVNGAGTSLDNSLRFGEPVDTEWVLLELDADVAVGGLGHGQVRLWSPDGRLMATGGQSARLFTMDDFLNRSAG
jgi:acyl-CoA thioesterase